MSEQYETTVPVEYDDAGFSTDVEAECETPEDRIEDPFDPAKIDVITRSVTVGLMLARLRRGVLDLSPDFQRLTGIWNETNQSKLIESLLLRIPLPTFYAAEVGEEDWAVVDGIQRLSAIARFVAPKLIEAEPLRLKGLEYLTQYEGRAYSELPGALQTRVDETELIVHLIRSGTPEPVMYNIFARLNTGGRPLVSQEIRHALIPGQVRTLLRDLAGSAPFLAATQGTVKPTRMADREMVLRFLAFRVTDPDDYPVHGDLDMFLRDSMRLINEMNESQVKSMKHDFFRAMDASRDIFQVYAFRKHYGESAERYPVNKALFETESVNLAKMADDELKILRGRRNRIEDGFIELMGTRPFQESLSIATGQKWQVQYRFSAIERLLRG